jgi:hypothetical protein
MMASQLRLLRTRPITASFYSSLRDHENVRERDSRVAACEDLEFCYRHNNHRLCFEANAAS